MTRRVPPAARWCALAAMLLASLSCGDNTALPASALRTLDVSLPTTSLEQGQGTTARVAGLDQNGASIPVGAVAWSATPAGVVTVSDAGVVTAMAPGTAQVVATVGSTTGQRALTVTAPAGITINEVESSGGSPGDWAELYNPAAAAVDVSGWVMKDNDDTHIYTIPDGTTIAAGGYLVAEEADLGYGLGAADAVRVYSKYGVLVASYSWTAHAPTTYGRCPDGSGAFATTAASTKGAANSCGPVGGSTESAWPGTDDVQTVDGNAVFGGNLSGLTYEAATATTPAVLWAVRNGPGTLYRLVFDGTIWTPDAANGWGSGKAVHYPDGLGNADAEGVTFGGATSAAGVYVATERNNDASSISRNSILRFDPAASGTALTATNEWNLTSDLPAVGANLGIEAITWIPDSYLVSKQFFDEAKGHAYTPSEYLDHGTGLFFVGLEANGTIYGYALNHATNGFTRVATIASGHVGVMGMEFDRETGYLWATCDDGCTNRAHVLEIDVAAGSPTGGRFVVTRRYERPTSMPNINNEGFALATQAECSAGRKAAFWADDSETGGHAIRRATVPCGALP